MDGVKIVGNVAWTVNGAVHPGTAKQSKLVFEGSDMRSGYSATNLPATGIVGNITHSMSAAGVSYTPQLHIIKSGVIGNITWSDSTTAGYNAQLFMSSAILDGDHIVTPAQGIVAAWYAEDCGTSSSKALGGASGQVNLTHISNSRFTRPLVISGVSGGTLFNVRFASGAHNFTGQSGTLSMDAVSYASYFANVPTKGSETVVRLDESIGVKYTPAVGGDWPVAPTTVADALDKLAARLNVLEP
jgi:hypothetical protein